VFQGGVRGLVEDHRRRRFTKIPASVLDHRRFWDAMHAVTVEQLEEISRKIAMRIVECSGADCSSVALDMTNFATFIDSGDDKAPMAQRGKAKQKRADLRLVGLGLSSPGTAGSR
jgi:transposase